MVATLSSTHGAAESYPIMRITGDPSVRAPAVALNKMVCVVGRGVGVNLALPSGRVSKVHALIVQERGRIYIRDLASTNGVKVNRRPVREAELQSGDVVHVGSLDLHCASGFTPRDAAAGTASMEARRAPAAALAIAGGNAGHVPLDGRAVVIGRREACDLALGDDDEASPVHAVIFERDGRRFVRDLHSGPGTFVDGQRIHDQELTPGQEIQIGQTRIRYVLDKTAGAAEAEMEIPIQDDDAIPIQVADAAVESDQIAGAETTDQPTATAAIDAEIEAALEDDAPIPIKIDSEEPAEVEVPAAAIANDEEPVEADEIPLADSASSR
jgi:pSer/pThr/pTyr-binding forkhead associated (FHA) protein